MPGTLSHLLAQRAASDADRLAFAERDARLTFGELYAEAMSIAGGLAERGVEPRDRVVLSLPAGLAFVRAFWAVQLLGAVSCALNPHAPAATNERRAKRVRPKLVINHVDEIPRGRAMAPHDAVSGNDVAVLQTTSGTSGEPRAAMITHANILASADAAREMGVTRDSVFVSWVPPWHDLGLIRFLITAVHAGAECHIVPPAVQTIPEWLRTIARVRGTFTGAPDFAYRLAARFVDPRTVDLSSLQYARSGGEPVRLSTIESFEKTFDVAGVIKPGYGLAEATLGVTSLRADEPLRVDERGNVSCGTALPDVELRIDAAEGEPGEILVRGPILFAGYFEAEEATREVLRDGWLHTGDTGRLDRDGHLYVLGRTRAMLKRGGSVLAPRELEEAAQEVDGVKIAAAVGLASETATEAIAVVVEVDGAEDLERVTRDVAESVRTAVGFLPERVIVLGPRSLPRTANGKLRHDVLRTMLVEGTLERDGAILSG